MRHVLFILMIVAGPGCQNLDCADGTIDKGGHCVPADETTGTGICGDHTHLVGDRCEPDDPPTECDPTSTIPQVDPTTGVTTCIGTGGGGCSATFACPQPAGSMKTTVCGQIRDLATDMPFQGANPTGAKCDPTMPTASGPCSLYVNAGNVITQMPFSATEDTYIDDCGRFRIKDIDLNGYLAPIMSVTVDDGANPGETGVTDVTSTLIAANAGETHPGIELFVVAPTPSFGWMANGLDITTAGVGLAVMRKHACNKLTGACTGTRSEPASGVTLMSVSGADSVTFHYMNSSLAVQSSETATDASGFALYHVGYVGPRTRRTPSPASPASPPRTACGTLACRPTLPTR